MIGILNLIGSALTGFFGFKGSQAKVVEKAMSVVGDANATAQARDVAAAQILIAEAQSESWLTRTWRPLFMVTFMVMLLSYWFGYVPPQLLGPMPPIIDEIFTLIQIGLGGYIPVRGLEKMLSQFQLGGILKKFVEKKLS